MQQNKISADSQKPQGLIQGRERQIAEIRQFNLLSDTFMTAVLKDIPACQHVLRILTGVDDLVVKEVRTQYRISKITSHDAILDVLAEGGGGKLYSLEIQRADTIDHARRVRFYGAMIDSEYLEKGGEYATLPEVYIIYVSEKDLWKAGRVMYPVKKYFEIGKEYEDGIHVMYVNTAVNDGTAVAELMDYFTKADPEDMSQGALSERVRFLKCEEGGLRAMCKVTDWFVAEGRTEGRAEGRAASVIALLEDLGTVASELSERIWKERDDATLCRWLKLAARAGSVEQFTENM